MLQPDRSRGLAAKGVSIAYERMFIVEGLNLVIPSGVFTALVGPNGSGKSTILRTLAGLLSPKIGTIELDGRSISDLSTKDVARRIGALAQGPVAPEGLTVLELVRQGRYPHRSLFGCWSEHDDEACDAALALTGMEELRARPIDSLSGGQRQRVWIAMTLAQETDILLLDEPTTYLDLSHQIEIMELLRLLVVERGKTVVAVLHDLNQAARYAGHMVLLDAGRVVAEGVPDEVVTADNIARVFGIAASVTPDPFTGTPMYIPLATQRSRELCRPGP
jgi:iron complex transport system ATP-binding protein